ncbi:MAG: tRNA modification GTPase MnmE [Phycisphaerae bacterium]|nr:tRNA modification GTPase MnmE [Phycisphaerae bacterium]
MDWNDLDSERTIVAVGTAAGPGLRAVVRLSGPDCLSVAARAMRAAAGLEGPGFAAVAAEVRVGRSWLPVTAWRFRSPHSYTGQDMLELHLPGSAALMEAVVGAFLSAGARAAEPGEFTLRAVLGGRIELTEAEGVAALIAARSDGQLRAAMELAGGALARAVGAINDRLVDLLAELEAGLDFADEPIRFITAGELSRGLADAAGAIARLQAESGNFESLADRPTVALVGPPNVGKSTLLNRLTGVERALCSPLAGTTRDVLAAPLTLADGEAILLDLAGLEQEPGDAISRLAQQAAEAAVRSADCLLRVADASASQPGAAWTQAGGREAIRVYNKVDLAPGPLPAEGVCVSATTGQGIEALRAAINASVFADVADRRGQRLMLNARHRAGLADAAAAVGRSRSLAAREDFDTVAELAAHELREASEHLGRISGRVVTDDILTRIFSRFCIGK